MHRMYIMCADVFVLAETIRDSRVNLGFASVNNETKTFGRDIEYLSS